MKKMTVPLLFVLIIACIFSSCAKTGDGNTLETADSVIDVTNEAGSVSMNEETARLMLGTFTKEVLKLDNELDTYTLKLSETTVLESPACLVEAFADNAEAPVQKYAIIGIQCFIFDETSGEYLLLTQSGGVPVKINTAESETAGNDPNFVYDVENHKALTEKFKGYSAAELGTEKEITEYILTAKGNAATAADGETVYIVSVFEKDGTQTDYMLAFNESSVYAPGADGVFEKLN